MREALRLQCTPSELRTLFCVYVADGANALSLIRSFGAFMVQDPFPALSGDADITTQAHLEQFHHFLRTITRSADIGGSGTA